MPNQQVVATTLASRARTMMATASSVELLAGDWHRPVARHAIDLDGSILLPGSDLVGGPPCGAADGTPAPVLTLTATDVSSVPQPDRVRGSVILRGPVHRVTVPLPEGVREYLTDLTPAVGDGPRDVVRLYPTVVSVQWRCEGSGSWRELAMEDYTCAELDPLAGWEAEWIGHLAGEHDEVLTRLVRQHAPGRDVGRGELRPLLADRLGLVVRHYGRLGDVQDVRVPFAGPARCGCEAVDSLNQLVAALPTVP